MVSIDEFRNMEIKVAKVVEVKDHPNADKLYVLNVDIAGEIRQIVAGIKKFYTPEELLNKNVIVVANLVPAVIRGVESNGMLLAASVEENLAVLTTDRPIISGAQVR